MVQSLEELMDLVPANVVTVRGAVPGQSDGGPFLEIDCNGNRAGISMFGGQILHWQPSGHAPVLWLSDGAWFDRAHPIRGGIPVCWPWFAGHDEHAEWPAHGFARTTNWRLDEALVTAGAVELQLSLPVEEWHQQYWPYKSRPVIHFTIANTLAIELATVNIDAQDITFGEALHTYFAVDDIAAVDVGGLETSPYFDKLSGEAGLADERAIVFDTEIDRIYRGLDGPIVLRDKGRSRRIVIEHGAAENAVVWNPWAEKTARLDDMAPSDAYRGMVCVETGNVAPDAVTLSAGETHTMRTSISVQRYD